MRLYKYIMVMIFATFLIVGCNKLLDSVFDSQTKQTNNVRTIKKAEPQKAEEEILVKIIKPSQIGNWEGAMPEKVVRDYIPANSFALCNAKKLRIREHPRVKDSKTLGYLIIGEKVTILEVSEEKMVIGDLEDYWYKVRNDDKLIGWVYGNWLRKYSKQYQKELLYRKREFEEIDLFNEFLKEYLVYIEDDDKEMYMKNIKFPFKVYQFNMAEDYSQTIDKPDYLSIDIIWNRLCVMSGFPEVDYKNGVMVANFSFEYCTENSLIWHFKKENDEWILFEVIRDYIKPVDYSSDEESDDEEEPDAEEEENEQEKSDEQKEEEEFVPLFESRD